MKKKKKSKQFIVSSRQSAVGGRQLAVSSRQPAVYGLQSAVASQQLTIFRSVRSVFSIFYFPFSIFHFPFSVFLLFTAYFLLPTAAHSQRCSVVQYDSVLAQRYPYWRLKRAMLEDSIQSFMRLPARNNARSGAFCEKIRIPVVVHIVHNNVTGTAGGRDNSNITDEQIKEQIRVLNEDYRRKSGTRGANNNPVGADTGIEFFLVPNGITRHLYTQKSTFDIFSDDQLLADITFQDDKGAWPTDRYLNIWVSRFSNNYLGIAQFPSVTGVPGLDNSNSLQERTDGVFIDFRVFGIGSAVTSRLYNLGRTTTHEIGHWLGLVHTWGDTNCGDDYCADTPRCEAGNQTNNCGPVFSNCGGVRTRNMTENFLDYSPDSCMNIFTQNQADRMLAVIEKAPRRNRLVKYWCAQLPFGDYLSVELYPNPAADLVNIKVVQKTFGTFDIQIYSMTGQLVSQTQYQDYPSWVVEFPTTKLPAGAYIVRVKTKDETVTQRLIIMR